MLHALPPGRTIVYNDVGGNMKTILCILLSLCIYTGNLNAAEPLTVVEKTDFTRTSLYDEVMDYLFALKSQSPLLELAVFGESFEGRMIPLVIVSASGVRNSYDLHRQGLPAVLIMANIHAGEVEGKEAVQMLLRDFAFGRHLDWLDGQVVLFLPVFNADGNEKIGKNRRDNGPEEAGVRHNGQGLDLNRDYIKLDSPEVNALVKLLREWDPVLVVDLHTTNGSYHRHPVTYSTMAHPNSPVELRDYMWQKFYPAVGRELLEKYGYSSIPYGNFSNRSDPQKGWANDAFEVRYGSNYVGLRNRFTVLDENYSHADFRTRVLSCLAFLKSILSYTSVHINEMAVLAAEADRQTSESFTREQIALSYRVEKLFDMVVNSYEFELERIKKADLHKYPAWYGGLLVRKTDRERDYQVPYLAKAVIEKGRSLPAGYLLDPFQPEVIEKIRAHGVVVHRLLEDWNGEIESFQISGLEMARNIFQGRVAVSLKGDYKSEIRNLPAGSHFVSLNQPLARLAAVMLEPEGSDSLAAWGFFNRVLVRQWSAQPGKYPVYRVAAAPKTAMIQLP